MTHDKGMAGNRMHGMVTSEVVKKVQDAGLVGTRQSTHIHKETYMRIIRFNGVANQFYVHHNGRAYYARPQFIGGEPKLGLNWTTAP